MATLHQFTMILNTVSSCAPFCFLVGICNLACICGKFLSATVKMVLYDYIYSFKYSPYVFAISFLLNYRWHHFQICARKNKYCIIWICGNKNHIHHLGDCSTMFTQFMFSHFIWLRDQTWLCVLLVSNSRGCCFAALGNHEGAAPVIPAARQHPRQMCFWWMWSTISWKYFRSDCLVQQISNQSPPASYFQ